MIAIGDLAERRRPRELRGVVGDRLPDRFALRARRRMTRIVYIVEDDDGVRASLQGLLSLRSGQVVRTFSSGDRFLADAGLLDPGVVLLDFHMPGANGMDVLDTLRLLYPRKFAPLILTGVASVGLTVRALQAGALDFIEKPYGSEMLLDSIDDAFSGLTEESNAAARVTAAQTKIDSLSPREREVLMCLIEGHANRAIAGELDISSRTVEIYRANLMAKLSVSKLSAALRVAFAAGMIPQT